MGFFAFFFFFVIMFFYLCSKHDLIALESAYHAILNRVKSHHKQFVIILMIRAQIDT